MLPSKCLKILLALVLTCLLGNVLYLRVSTSARISSSIHSDVFTVDVPGTAGKMMSDVNNSTVISDGTKELQVIEMLSAKETFKSDTTFVPLKGIPTTRNDNSNTSWKYGTFCHNFIIDTFRESVPVCRNSISDQVRCYVNKDTELNNMGQCIFRNFAMSPAAMQNVISNTKWNEPSKVPVHLLSDTKLTCQSPTIDLFKKNTQHNDYQVKLLRLMIDSPRLSKSVCDVWINKTVLFHVSNAFHVYFRFLDFYNIHKTLIDYHLEEGDHHVMRISNLGGQYIFPEFENKLFPGTLSLNGFLENVTICFRKVVNVPRSYQSIPFRCKMDNKLKEKCFKCNGKGLSGSPLQTFRKRVLHACNLEDKRPIHNSTSVITVILRKPYKRWSIDNEKFPRILENGDEMIDEIRHTFHDSIVNKLYLEDLDICDQVKHALEADVMIGVHGAGLVHFWWMREEATAIELEPEIKFGNPSFRMLTSLSGRKYKSIPIISIINEKVLADIGKVVRTVKAILKVAV